MKSMQQLPYHKQNLIKQFEQISNLLTANCRDTILYETITIVCKLPGNCEICKI